MPYETVMITIQYERSEKMDGTERMPATIPRSSSTFCVSLNAWKYLRLIKSVAKKYVTAKAIIVPICK